LGKVVAFTNSTPVGSVRVRPPLVRVVLPLLARRAVKVTGRPALTARGAFTLTTGQAPWASRVGREEKTMLIVTRTVTERENFMAVFVVPVGLRRCVGWGEGEKEGEEEGGGRKSRHG
jgi:hypothetical protein